MSLFDHQLIRFPVELSDEAFPENFKLRDLLTSITKRRSLKRRQHFYKNNTGKITPGEVLATRLFETNKEVEGSKTSTRALARVLVLLPSTSELVLKSQVAETSLRG